MQLILHIGTEKTGTTSLQSWLGLNRGALREAGIFFPLALGETRSIAMSIMAADFDDGGKAALRNHKIGSPADLEAFTRRTEKAFAAELEQARREGCRVCFVSDEGLQAALTHPGEVARVRDFAARHFGQSKVVVTLRPQVDYAVSLASTLARHGIRISGRWFDRVTPENHRFDYDGLIGLWEGAFGAEAVDIRTYASQADSIGAFRREFGLAGGSWAPVARENSFLDWRHIRLLNGLQPQNRKRLQKVIVGQPSTERLQIGSILAMELTARFEEGNRRLAARRTDITMRDLTPDLSAYAAVSNLHLLDRPKEFDALDALVSVLTGQVQGGAGRGLRGSGRRRGGQPATTGLRRFQRVESKCRDLSEIGKPVVPQAAEGRWNLVRDRLVEIRGRGRYHHSDHGG